MATVPYAHITQGPAIVRPVGPAVVTPPRRTINPLLPLCCLGLILFLIAATIVISLIPVYLSRRDVDRNEVVESYRYNTLYQINNGALPVGTLSADNCATIQADQRNLAASNRDVSPSTPTTISCTVIGNTTDIGRRRRQANLQPKGNVISINGRLTSGGNCRRGSCGPQRLERFLQLLRNRGSFVLTLIDANGVATAFTLTVISATILPEETPALTNDLAILNYALVLEQLEAAFYTQFQNRFTAQDFIAANYSQQTYDYFNIIYVHELAHTRIVTAVISQLGGTPVSPCTYNFNSVTDVRSYVSVSRVLETTGTMAYDGAVNGIANPALRQASATIATVEARHSAYLNALNGISPFPTAFENATVPSVVIAAIQPFIVSCPFTLTAPTVPYIGATSYSGSVPTSNNSNTSPYTNLQYLNDLRVLNLALISEHLESTFYNRYVSNFTAADFNRNGFPDATMNFIMIREYENAHVQFLETTITQRRGTPVSYCTYNFPVTDVRSFVNISRTLENTGTGAYIGAIDKLTDPALILGGATIATVEARFASYLNNLTGVVPFPSITDTPIEPPQVVAILSQFQTCPFTPDLPVRL